MVTYDREGFPNLEASFVGQRCAEVVAKFHRIRIEVLNLVRSCRDDLADAGKKRKQITWFVGERVFAMQRADEGFEQLLASLLRVKTEDVIRQRELK